MFLPSLKTKEQPILPKYLPSHLRLISRGILSLGKYIGRSRKRWKWRVRVLRETLEVSMASRGTPDDIHVLKALKYLRLLFNLLRVKVLPQDLHRYLTSCFESPHLIQHSPQKIHF